jgi:ATP-dependent Lhr-like helicase
VTAPFDSFHPATARWFSETFGSATRAQLGGWPSIREHRHTLIAAPTGSGKTLAAFLSALDGLLMEGLAAPLPDEVRVVYVSPLKALSADIHKNLAEPRRGIAQAARDLGFEPPEITAAVRTGDTPQADRAAMLRRPPHILVTTPESLFLLLTASRSREMLRTARTVIVDEIHAVIGTRRGAHLALSLERLQQLVDRPLVRIGLSATQSPIEDVARFLVGSEAAAGGPKGVPACTIVDEGHRRAMDLGLELPGAPLEAVMSTEQWDDYYNRLATLVASHKTTLVFVNTRKLAERIARHLSDRLGEDAVMPHHGSLSKEKRLDAETRLKSGTLKALVATASLELGIDIGHVDLACQIGSPHRIATFLQRIGRSGHSVSGLPKGRLFPTSRDDLIECAALLRAVKRGELDRIVEQGAPLDVLTQQIVAETASREYHENELFDVVRRAWPYRNLDRSQFDAVVEMAANGFATRRGRRGALIHRDEIQHRLRGRRGAQLVALTSGGAIPEVADYRVLLDPEETFLGTLNEDFAIESNVGDIFQLGNASWRVLQVGTGIVRVADAKGAPPTIPFWLGEAPARSDELSRAVSGIRADVEARLSESGSPVTEWLASESGISQDAADQAIAYLTRSRETLGTLPTQEALVLERFFDESGGMQLVLHAPLGSRINKAWGLALRKRFCRQFNFELQAAATEDALLLSLGPQHSFPLADVFRYLHPATVRDVLVQAFLDAPVFQTRWRWNTTVSLAVPRARGGKKVAPQLQRMLAEDLLAAVFPDAAACLENIPGDRQIPDHPLVAQTIRDCLHEAMDFDGLVTILGRIHRGELRLISRDSTEPSPLAHEILNARPYAFLDDAPLEERRTQAVLTRRASDPASASGLGRLDANAIARVVAEAAPDPRDGDELHDALMTVGWMHPPELTHVEPLIGPLVQAGRIALVTDPMRGWIAAERWPELLAIHSDPAFDGSPATPASRVSQTWTRENAIIEMIRGRLTLTGPTTTHELAGSLGVDDGAAEAALLALESEGVVLRGSFRESSAGGSGGSEWCDRSLLARIHRYTVARLRAEIEPVSPADFMRFLFMWQHVDTSRRLSGIEGLRVLVSTLDGFEVAAAAWERSILPSRMDRYDAALLDMLCLTGEVSWARTSAPSIFDADRRSSMSFTSGTSGPRLVGATPIALYRREHADAWQTVRAKRADAEPRPSAPADEPARVVEALSRHGALFSREIAAQSGLSDGDVTTALGELVSSGVVTSDGFAGLRALVRADERASRKAHAAAGRWSLVRSASGAMSYETAVEIQAQAFLQRYGVVFARLLTREANAAPWRDLARVYRRLEARGEIRGGRFVSGMSGEQFALPDAVAQLREIRRTAPNGALLTISAADSLNLAGVITAGDRVRAVGTNRIVYRDGVPLAVLEGDYMRMLTDVPSANMPEVVTALGGRAVPEISGGYIGRM